MKKVLLSLLLISLHLFLSARQQVFSSRSDTAYFEQAYTEMAAMLDGLAPVSIKRAVFLHEWAYLDGKPDYNTYCSQIDTTTRALQRFIAANHLEQYRTGANFALFEYFSRPYSMNGHTPFTYDFEDFSGADDYTKLFVTKVMRTHSGQCRSLPMYYMVLAEAIGAEAHITFAPQHLFIRHRDEQDPAKWVNVELTTQSLSREIFYIENFGISDNAIRNKVYLYPLSDRETIAYLLSELAAAYGRRFGRHDDFILRCTRKALDYYPQNTLALQLKGNTLNANLMDYIERHGNRMDDYAHRLDSLWMENNAVLHNSGWAGMTESTYKRLLKGVDEDMKRRGIDSLSRARIIQENQTGKPKNR